MVTVAPDFPHCPQVAVFRYISRPRTPAVNTTSLSQSLWQMVPYSCVSLGLMCVQSLGSPTSFSCSYQQKAVPVLLTNFISMPGSQAVCKSANARMSTSAPQRTDPVYIGGHPSPALTIRL